MPRWFAHAYQQMPIQEPLNRWDVLRFHGKVGVLEALAFRIFGNTVNVLKFKKPRFGLLKFGT